MKNLSSANKKYLRGLAHSIEPVVLVGINGLSEVLVNAIDKALLDHELIKIKFNKYKEDKKRLCVKVEEETHSEMVGLIGNVAIFYRMNEDEEKRKIFFDN